MSLDDVINTIVGLLVFLCGVSILGIVELVTNSEGEMLGIFYTIIGILSIVTGLILLARLVYELKK